MKRFFVLFFVVNVLFCIYGYSQFPDPVYDWMFNWGTRYTPKGDQISAGVLKEDYVLTVGEKATLKDYWLWYYQNRITFISEATRTYNCHGYAWHVSEGGDNVWINTPNDDKYWTEGTYDASYKQISSQTNAKVAFVESADHSAIRTSVANIFISKWGQAPRFQHNINDCPYEPKTNLKYYTLDPKMTGSESILCYNVEREFETNITHMTEATLTWTEGYYLTYVSGEGTPEYTVKGKVGGGYSYVNFQITTPSGFWWSDQKNFFVGTPYVNPATIEFTCVEGPGYFCTNAFGNEYTFTYTGPYNYFDVKLTNLSETQTLYQDRIYSTWSTLEYWPPEGTYKFMVRGNNDCGTSH